MRPLFSASLIAAALAAASPSPARAVDQHLGAHDLHRGETFERVIDTRCTVCHTRERVDQAIREQRSLEELQKRMIRQGAILTEGDRKVLGTFWGEALKTKQKTIPSH